MDLSVKQYSLQDYLEPGEKGLVVLTNPPPISKHRESDTAGRLFLWMVGRPRKVFQNKGSLSWLTVHNGELFAQYSFDETFMNNCFRNIKTGEVIIPREEHSYGYNHYCSNNGDLLFINTEYTSDKYIKREWGLKHTPGYTDSIFYRWENGKKQEFIKKRAEVRKVLDSEDGVLVSMMPEPRGSGDNFVENIMTGESVYVEPKRYNGFDLGQIEAMCFIGDRLVFDRYPHGIWDLQKNKIANFPFIEFMQRRESEIAMKIPKPSGFGNYLSDSEKRERESIIKEELRELEMRTARILGYSYEKAMGAESDSWRRAWGKEARRFKNDPEGLYRRIALSRFVDYRFKINHLAYFNNHLILASNQNLYAVPVFDSGETVINPFKNRLWTFQDNICGIAVVEGEELRRLKGNASVRGKRKSSSASVPRLLKIAA